MIRLVAITLLAAASAVTGLQCQPRTVAWATGPGPHAMLQPRRALSGCSGGSALGPKRCLTARSLGSAADSGRRRALGGGEMKGSLLGGVRGLVSQQQDFDTDDSDLEEAEAAEGVVQKFVLGGIGGLVVLGLAGYCVYMGESPAEALTKLQNLDFKQSMTDLVGYIDGLGPVGYLYFSSVYIVAEMLAIPAIPLAASAGYLFGVTKGTLVVLLSATVAAGGAFMVGRLALRQWVETLIAKSRKFQAIDEAISRKGFQLVLLLRLSPLLPFAISNYIYGMTKVNIWEYLAATFIGFAPGTLAFVMTGQVGRELSGGDAGGGLPWYGYAAGAAGIFYVGSVVAKIAGKAIAEVEQESEEKKRREVGERLKSNDDGHKERDAAASRR